MPVKVKYPTLLFLLFSLNACHTSDDPTKSIGPCVSCPIDFRVTDFEPAWDPDGKYIAYVHGDTSLGKTGIYLIAPDGTDNHIWYSSAGAYSPTWSPDGQWIAFSEGGQIWKKKLNGDSLTQLTSEGSNFFPSWSPDGKSIVYDNTTCGSSGSVPSYNSCGILKISSSLDLIPIKFLVSGRMPFWVRNGNNDEIIYSGLYSEIYKFNIADSSKVRLTHFNESNPYAVFISYPKKSSSTNKIIFTAQPLNNKVQIWIIDADGNNARQLTSTQGYSCDWSPDGQKIVYTDSRAVSGRLWIMNADGSGNHQLTNATQF